MNSIYNWFSRTEAPSSAIVALAGGLPSHEWPMVFCPAPDWATRPTAAIIYQAHHNRETGLIDEYEALEQNWDGYDADPISKSACTAAKLFLNALPSTYASPELCPNPGGTISMEWEAGNAEAELELGKTKYSFYLRRKGGPTVYHKGELDEVSPMVYGLLAALYSASHPTAIAKIEY